MPLGPSEGIPTESQPTYPDHVTPRVDLSNAAGALSVAVTGVQYELTREQENLRLLQSVVEVLPCADRDLPYDTVWEHYRGAFEIPKDDDQAYVARRLQAHILWLPSLDANPIPYYVGGMAQGLQRSTETSLLLLPAAEGKSDEPSQPLIVAFRDTVVASYREWRQRHLAREYSPTELDELVDGATGNVVISPRSPGSVRVVAPASRRQLLSAQFAEEGVMPLASWKRKPQGIHGISDELLQAYGVNSTIKQLVSAFGVEREYDSLLNERMSVEVVEVATDLSEGDATLRAIINALLKKGRHAR